MCTHTSTHTCTHLHVHATYTLTHIHILGQLWQEPPGRNSGARVQEYLVHSCVCSPGLRWGLSTHNSEAPPLPTAAPKLWLVCTCFRHGWMEGRPWKPHPDAVRRGMLFPPGPRARAGPSARSQSLHPGLWTLTDLPQAQLSCAMPCAPTRVGLLPPSWTPDCTPRLAWREPSEGSSPSGMGLLPSPHSSGFPKWSLRPGP